MEANIEKDETRKNVSNLESASSVQAASESSRKTEEAVESLNETVSSIEVNTNIQTELESNEELKETIEASYEDKLEEIIENFDPDKIIKIVEGWSIGKFVLLFICTLILSLLMGYMGWNFFSFHIRSYPKVWINLVWDPLLAFISNYGDELINFGANFIGTLSQSLGFQNFRDQLVNLTTSSELILPNNIATNIIFGGLPFLLSVVKYLFQFLKTQFK